jgi:hypothetical protein
MTTSGSPIPSSAAWNSPATAAGSEASTWKVAAPVSAASAVSFSVLRAARPTLTPCAASARATEALIPEPAPTIRALR